MKASTLSSVLLSLLITACDPYYRVVVTVPMAHALATVCVQAAFDSIVRPLRTDPSNPQGSPLRNIVFVAGEPYADLEQHEYKDSTAALETSVGRWSFLGGRFNRAEVDTIGRELSATLTTVRDKCGGAVVAGTPPYRVKQRPF